MEDDEDTQNWDEFVKELKIMFSDKSKAVDAEWKIEMFKQGKKYIANFMIEFKTLTMKAETNNLHVIFFTKEEYLDRYYKDNTRISIRGSTKDT